MAKRVEDALRAEWQRILAERPSDLLGMAWSRRFVRAAIEAMREPTEAMLKAAQWSVSDGNAVATWRDMIDAALKETSDAGLGKGEVGEMRERLTQAFCDWLNRGRSKRYCTPGERCYDCPEMADVALKTLGALKETSDAD